MNFSELCKHNHLFLYIFSDHDENFTVSKNDPPLSHFVRHLIFIIGQSIAVFFGSRQPSLNLASLSAKLYNSIYIAKNKKAKKKMFGNSEFAEHPPSLDTIRPLCNASIISSFLCSFLSPQS